MQPIRQRDVTELSADALAQLIHHRLRIERAQGWAVFGAFVAAFSGVFLLSGHVRSDLLLALYASCMATMAAGVNAAVERLSWRIFFSACRDQGLNEAASRELYDRASGAGQWLAVLQACGSHPTNTELAAFVFADAPKGA